MVVEIVTVGTELLMGNIVNTHARYLSEKCALLGLSVYYQTVVGDNPGRMAETFRLALSRADILLVTGGLGPTEDDLTKEIAAEVMAIPLEENLQIREQIREYLEKNVYDVIPESNYKQAMLPVGSRIFPNANGTAVGLAMEKEGKRVILLPGPPSELYPMFETYVEPYLRQLHPEVIHSAMVKICGIGESKVEEMVRDMIDAQTNPTIATYAKLSEVDMRVTAKGESLEACEALLAPVLHEMEERFGNYIFTTREKESLEEVVVGLLAQKALRLAVAESCTGGLVTGKLINVPGASEVLEEGFVTYSNEAKHRSLGVSLDSLGKFGAVSEEVAREMAEGAARKAGADVGLSITGIAGPGGGTSEKPVGLVYMACSCARGTFAEVFRFRGNRNKVREQAVMRALNLVRLTVMQPMDRME